MDTAFVPFVRAEKLIKQQTKGIVAKGVASDLQHLPTVGTVG